MTTEDTKAQEAPTFTTAIKGFNADLTCRGFQFAAGGEYRHDGPVKACESGFHAITGHPLAVFDYYAPAGSRFFRVEIGGATDSDDDDKTAAEILRVGQEVGFAELVAEAVKHVTERATMTAGDHATGDRSASSATGYQSASSATGYRSASSATGDRSASSATGDRSASLAVGDRSASSATGYQSASSATGYQSASSATGDRSASSATGYRSASSATGYQSASSATGDRSASSATGYQSASLAVGYLGQSSAGGNASVAIATGHYGQAMAAEGCGIALFERDDNGAITAAFAGVAGRDGVKADTWYTLTGGKLTEVEG